MMYSDGGLSASASEIEEWEKTRPDIHAYVNAGKIWMNPDTGEQLKYCPWLTKLPGQQKYICEIYEDRPEDCRVYPTTFEEMVRHECEMLESHDLANRRQAQTALDELMSDHRPPLESK